MGRDKSRIRARGRSLLAWSTAAARNLGLRVRVIRRDAVPRCGPIGGIVTALTTTRSQRVLFLSCDMPSVQEKLIERLLAFIGGRHQAAFVEMDGWLGFPFALRSTALPKVLDFWSAGNESLQGLAQHLNAHPCRVAGVHRKELINLNTPDALKAFRRSLTPNRTVPHHRGGIGKPAAVSD